MGKNMRSSSQVEGWARSSPFKVVGRSPLSCRMDMAWTEQAESRRMAAPGWPQQGEREKGNQLTVLANVMYGGRPVSKRRVPRKVTGHAAA